MRTIILLGGILFASTFSVISQTQKSEANDKVIVSKSVADQSKTDANPGSVANVSRRNQYVRPDAKKRFNRYLISMFGPVSLGKDIAKSGFQTWTNSPEEWGDHWEGFGRRVASNIGRDMIENTAIYGIDESFKIDSSFYRSRNRGVGSRIKNALISPVTARSTDGKRVFGVSRVAGTYAGSIIAAETWYPARYNWKDGLKSGTYSLGLDAAFNLIKEFIWKK
ncbi:MAG: hypothetical protein ABI999_03290 [Acidobacteriota bacterium]